MSRRSDQERQSNNPSVPTNKPDEGEDQPEDRLQFDLHTIKTIFPDPVSVFGFRLERLSEIKDKAIVVPDTNALLVPYRTPGQTLEQLRKLYRGLIQGNRFFVPGQVAREFARLRPNRIGEILKEWNDNKSRIHPIPSLSLPILSESNEYREFLKTARKANEAIEACKKPLDSVRTLIQNWQLNDPVSEIYRTLFTSEVVVDPPIDNEAILKERQTRKAMAIPPGYKDPGLNSSTHKGK